MRYLYIGFINSIHRTSHSLYHSFLRTDDLQEKNKLVRERRLAKKVAREQYSLRMSALYKLSVANHFRDHVFWLPINLDFRGRVYPIPPHCAHVGEYWFCFCTLRKTFGSFSASHTLLVGSKRIRFHSSIGKVLLTLKSKTDWLLISAYHIIPESNHLTKLLNVSQILLFSTLGNV